MTFNPQESLYIPLTSSETSKAMTLPFRLNKREVPGVFWNVRHWRMFIWTQRNPAHITQ
jgi:hypothetical protein